MKEPETRYDMERMLLEAQLLQVEDRLAELNRTPLEDMERQMYLDLIKALKESNASLLQYVKDIKPSLDKVDSVAEQLGKANTALKEAYSMIEALKAENAELKKKRQEVDDLEEEKKRDKRLLYGQKSLKGRKAANDAARSREEEKDEYDGSDNDSDTPDTTEGDEGASAEFSNSEQEAKQPVESRPYRKGMTYKKMTASEQVIHECDLSHLPEGYHLEKIVEEDEFDRIVKVVKHTYKVAILRNSSTGETMRYYQPLNSEDTRKPRTETVDGTPITPEFMAEIITNKYQLHQPIHREIVRLKNEKMSTCKQSVINWTMAGVKMLNPLMSHIKAQLLRDGDFIHSDETWCRVCVSDGERAGNHYAKKYIWLVINESTKVAYYFYDNGSRGRKAIREFLGLFKGSIQTDAYVAYRYLNSTEISITHLVCMAHVRAKFKEIQLAGSSTMADYFIEMIGQLYNIEIENRLCHRSEEEIRKVRQRKALPILSKLKQRAEELRDGQQHLSKKMTKALNYMLNNWEELIRYTEDGRYTIDNNVAERAIRPLTVGRKNFMGFGSENGVRAAMVLYTVIETCLQRGVSPKEYLTRFFRWMKEGRTDYEAMLPALSC